MSNVEWLVLLILTWVGLVAGLLVVRRRQRLQGSGLVYAYLASLGAIHWLGAVIYLLPWFRGPDPEAVVLGFVQSVYATAGFVLGSVLVTALTRLVVEPARAEVADAPAGLDRLDLSLCYLGAGVLCGLILVSPAGRWPTLRATVSSGQQLVVIGLCLLCWRLWWRGRRRVTMWLLGATLALPMATVLYSGFFGPGAVATLVVFIFTASFFRPRRRLVFSGIALAYLGMSFYVSYMRDRGEIREVVWGGRPVEDRLEQVFQTVTTLEWFDPTSTSHLYQIDRRLNQNLFVGVAVDRLRQEGDFALGSTILDALSAFIPRIVWPDKPSGAGSGELVSRYTGFRFSEGTSVGIGQVMEFYVNFGTPGVVLGFVVMGFLVTVLDNRARRGLDSGDERRFALWYLIGLGCLQVGGSLVDVVGTAASGAVAALVVNVVYDHTAPARRASVAASPDVSWSQ
jgi:hypothetical protein